MQQLPGLHVAAAIRKSLGEHRVVAAPCEMHAMHPADPLAEAAPTGEQQRRVLVRGPAAQVLGDDGTVVPRGPDRVELSGPTTFEAEQLVGLLGQRQADRQRIERVPPICDVRERRPNAEDVADGDLGRDRQPGRIVDGIDRQHSI